MRSDTTTTTRPRKRPRSAPALPAGDTRDDLQRCALTLAEAGGWNIDVEAAAGGRLRLRVARPAYTLVLSLGAGAGALDLAELYP